MSTVKSRKIIPNNIGNRIRTRTAALGPTGYKGVTWDGRRDAFVAYVDFNTPSGQHMHIHVGYFTTVKKAHNARKTYINDLR